MKKFTITVDEHQIQAIWLCADAALRSSGAKALDAAAAVQAALNSAVQVEEPAADAGTPDDASPNEGKPA